ncbi:hypothetical protein SMI01S_16010 [Sphingobacterium mizutaii NBRC 14946 = DSM 11724]|uniref:Uncharacterized protein n=2 Tax=Sphingobacterium mizutaii TaxID=1010 RepID=A0AAJ4X862_9SPHI|nr:hypothetical protein [Sphingobacterium mizutaii]GEM67995.1 hypothetical protein SMI01S_16010 [Sphingobacterium mizutaii NBRC 14946 = DSM 11724]SDL78919.1 hypothetical protein SAMN05192578_10989 [Sphingobacterium mizutaii]SNV37530.1 Uncharacterised protein [Sphingobacterium mizutaii]
MIKIEKFLDDSHKTMDTRLNKYTNFGFFTFLPLPTRKNCFQKCNAPANMSGVYLIYGIGFEKEELVYIGSSGKKTPEGKIKVRKGRAGMTGIK